MDSHPNIYFFSGKMDVGYLTTCGFIVHRDYLRGRLGHAYTQFLDKLTIVFRPKIGQPQISRLYSLIKYNRAIYIRLPRTTMSSFARAGVVSRIEVLLPPLVQIGQKLARLHDNQVAVVDYLCRTIFTPERLNAGSACAVLNARAGTGKTFVAGGLAARLGLRTLYIVPNKPLAMQARDDLAKCLEDTSAITVLVINTALGQEASFFDFSLIILDEVHMYCSAKRKEIFMRVTRGCLGMSATTEDRTDGFDIIAHKELAFDGIIRADAVSEFATTEIGFNCTVHLIHYYGPDEYTSNLTHPSTGKVFTPYMHKQYIRDSYRLRLAVEYLVRLYDWVGPNAQTHSIYIFAEEIGILQRALDAMSGELTARLRSDIAISAPELGLELFTGGLSREQVETVRASGRVLASTYGYAGTGISINKMTAILFLTPRKAQMKQICARILRRGSDISIPRIIVDIVDVRTALRHQFETRKLAYSHYGFSIIESRVRWSDCIGNCILNDNAGVQK